MRLGVPIVLALPFVVPATEAEACRVMRPPADLIAQGGYDVIVTAEIDRAAHVRPAAQGTRP